MKKTTAYEKLKTNLIKTKYTWLITGVAGFIGSNILETLLKFNQKVVGMDNFATGYAHNLEEVRSLVLRQQWKNFKFLKGDIRNVDHCRKGCAGVDFVLHQAALGSVPRSLENPMATHEANITGFFHMLKAAQESNVRRFVYASSSSVYGDHAALPKKEAQIGKPLSPYAVTKVVNELYAEVFMRCYGFKTVGLRYFNVFGRRQDPNGAYAAVIPKWFSGLLRGETIYINGDGKTSRDFCYVDNAVQANLLAAFADNGDAIGQVFNVAASRRTHLIKLFHLIRKRVTYFVPDAARIKPLYRDFRKGDVRHSLADITKAKKLLGYEPTHSVSEGIEETAEWYVVKSRPNQ